MVSPRASCAALGIDMEQLIDAPADVSDLIAQPEELALLAPLGAQRALTLLFSAKEALYKALYPEVRQFFDFTAARAAALGDCLQLHLTVPWGKDWPAGTAVPVRFAFEGRYVYTAVCVGMQAENERVSASIPPAGNVDRPADPGVRSTPWR